MTNTELSMESFFKRLFRSLLDLKKNINFIRSIHRKFFILTYKCKFLRFLELFQGFPIIVIIIIMDWVFPETQSVYKYLLFIYALGGSGWPKDTTTVA